MQPIEDKKRNKTVAAQIAEKMGTSENTYRDIKLVTNEGTASEVADTDAWAIPMHFVALLYKRYTALYRRLYGVMDNFTYKRIKGAVWSREQPCTASYMRQIAKEAKERMLSGKKDPTSNLMQGSDDKKRNPTVAAQIANKMDAINWREFT